MINSNHDFHPVQKPSSIYAKVMFWVLVANIPLCFMFVGLFLMIPIGAWQIIDALFWLLLGDRRRVPYLVIVLLYFAACYGASMLNWVGTGLLLFFFIVSYVIAFGYWYITRQHAREVVQVFGGDILDEHIGNDEQAQP